jgi:hypothetical protein
MPKQNAKIADIEWMRLILGVALFVSYNALLNKAIGLLYFGYMTVSLILIALLIGIVANTEAILAWIKKIGWIFLLPLYLVVYIPLNIIIAVIKALIFMLSGFDSKEILTRIEWLKFPIKLKEDPEFYLPFTFTIGVILSGMLSAIITLFAGGLLKPSSIDNSVVPYFPHFILIPTFIICIYILFTAIFYIEKDDSNDNKKTS